MPVRRTAYQPIQFLLSNSFKIAAWSRHCWFWVVSEYYNHDGSCHASKISVRSRCLFRELPSYLSNYNNSFKISAKSSCPVTFPILVIHSKYLQDRGVAGSWNCLLIYLLASQLPPECENFSALFNWKQGWSNTRRIFYPILKVEICHECNELNVMFQDCL